MNRQGRVLIVENEQRWRDVLADILRQGGFQADTAATLAEARQYFADSFYHLTVLDIRMEDDTDHTDIEGINLLRQLSAGGLTEATQVLVLSAHGTKDQMRESFKEHGIADFLSKDEFDGREFLRQVREIFAGKARINPNLVIHWQQITGPDQAVLNLAIEGERIKYKSPWRDRLAAELDDLLCRLFHRADSLLVKPLTEGNSGLAVLLATPSSAASGAGQPFIVKFGDIQSIAAEHERFQDYVRNFIGGGRITNVIDHRRTAHLGGIVYSLLGTAGNRLESFGSFYKRADFSKIREVLDDIFLVTCSQWYANPGRIEPRDLSAEYSALLELTPEVLEQHRGNLKSAQGKEKLRIGNLAEDRVFTNPIKVMAARRFIEHTYVCPTHGDLSETNVLVDETGHTWLIDFGRTGPGHILRDVATLDTAVRLHLLDECEATLEDRLKLEEALIRAGRFGDLQQLAGEFETDNPALAKTYATVIHLRSLAHRLVERNLNASLREYYVALFYFGLSQLKWYELPRIYREHALVSSSLLADKLEKG